MRDDCPEATKAGRERGTANVGAAGRGAVFSWIGELSKISDSDSEDDVAGLFEKAPLPKRKGGSWISEAFLCGMLPVLKPLALASEGRSGPCSVFLGAYGFA